MALSSAWAAYAAPNSGAYAGNFERFFKDWVQGQGIYDLNVVRQSRDKKMMARAINANAVYLR